MEGTNVRTVEPIERRRTRLEPRRSDGARTGRWLGWAAVAASVACAGAGPRTSSDERAHTHPGSTADAPEREPRRSVASLLGDSGFREGIAYGPHRAGQSPDGAQPSDAELVEDLEILAAHWSMLRVYGAGETSERILRHIRDRRLPLRVMLGAWVAPEPEADRPRTEDDRREANEREIRGAIALARAYPDVVGAVCVGNETQVFWSAHRVPTERLIELIRRVRSEVAQPVTTADDYNFWNRPESEAVAREIDFLVLHAYAMWNRQTLDDAVAWTATQVEAIRAAHPEYVVVLGETGWATTMHPSGDAARQIIGVAGEAEQAVFHRRFTEWAARIQLPHFYFEAFDEPWKGSAHPDEVEKHWGLFRVDRTPKPAMAQAHATWLDQRSTPR